MKNYLFNTNKIKYIKGKNSYSKCILCAINDGNPEVDSLIITKTENFILSVNLYPFNPGHLMIFPIRHIETPIELNQDEALEMHNLLVKTINVLQSEFTPAGFNIGANIGKGSGASIAHYHLHIVPRYENEIGFLDAISGVKVIVADPVKIMYLLKKRF
jgi:ATP adenylyltransferase